VIGFTALIQTPGDGKQHTLKELRSLPEGHRVKYVQVRNDPLKNSVTNGYVVRFGVDQDSSYPLLFGEAKVFDECDPARFTLIDPGAQVWLDFEVASCSSRCPLCG